MAAVSYSIPLFGASRRFTASITGCCANRLSRRRRWFVLAQHLPRSDFPVRESPLPHGKDERSPPCGANGAARDERRFEWMARLGWSFLCEDSMI